MHKYKISRHKTNGDVIGHHVTITSSSYDTALGEHIEAEWSKTTAYTVIAHVTNISKKETRKYIVVKRYNTFVTFNEIIKEI